MNMVCTCEVSRFFSVFRARGAGDALIYYQVLKKKLAMKSAHVDSDHLIISVACCGMLTHDNGLLGWCL